MPVTPICIVRKLVLETAPAAASTDSGIEYVEEGKYETKWHVK